MALKKIAAFLALTLYSATVFGNFSQIASLKELDEEVSKANEKTLIVFDVDEVLITTEDQFGHPSSESVVGPLLNNARAKAVTSEQKKELEDKLSLCFLQPKRFLVEKESPKYIKELQNKGIKVIALTSCRTGSFGVVPKVERWRIDHLLSLNINFDPAFSHVERCHLTEIAKEGISAPLYEQGVLFSRGYKKGEVLKAFLKKANFSPSKVIFIDDLVENLASVQEEMQALNIECKVYHYTGANKFVKKASEEILSYQLNHLLQKKQWLSDKEVSCLLKSQAKMLETTPFPKTKLAP
jgi:hypothetical protein